MVFTYGPKKFPRKQSETTSEKWAKRRGSFLIGHRCFLGNPTILPSTFISCRCIVNWDTGGFDVVIIKVLCEKF